MLKYYTNCEARGTDKDALGNYGGDARLDLGHFGG